MLAFTIKIILPVVISAGLVIWIYRSIDHPQLILAHVRSAAWPSLVVLVLMTIVPHVIRAWRWRRLLGERVPLFYAFTSVMIGYAVNNVLPRVGELTRIVNMHRMTEIPMAKLFATLVAERLLDLLALVFLLCLALALEGERLAAHFPWLTRTGPIAVGVFFAGAFGLLLLVVASEWLCATLGGLAGRLSQRLGARVQTVIRQSADGLAFIKRPDQALMVTLETAAIWFCYWVSYVAGLHAFGLTDALTLEATAVCFSITSCSALAPTIGGLGAYHYLGSESLISLYGASRTAAVACVTVEHFLVFYLVGGGLGILAWAAQCWRADRPQTQRSRPAGPSAP